MACSKAMQSWVLFYKHRYDFIADLFRKSESEIEKYHTRLTRGKSEYSTKKSQMSSEESAVSLAGVWQFFQLTNKNSEMITWKRDVISLVEKDLKISRYMLVDYPKQVLDQLDKLVKAISSLDPSKPDALKRGLKTIEGFKNAGTLFKREYLGDEILLNHVSLVEKVGDTRRPINLGDESFGDLAKLASPHTVVQSRSIQHSFGKVVVPLAGVDAYIDVLAAPKVSYYAQDIGTLFDFGLGYVDNAHKYYAMLARLNNIATDLGRALQKLSEGAAKSNASLQPIIQQLNQSADNMIQCFRSPAVRELSRAAMGAKYCSYLGLRMIHRARLS